jgi:hypothetical protein
LYTSQRNLNTCVWRAKNSKLRALASTVLGPWALPSAKLKVKIQEKLKKLKKGKKSTKKEKSNEKELIVNKGEKME